MQAHKQSYRPDLPLSSTPQVRVDDQRHAHATASLTAWADRVMREHDEKLYGKAPTSRCLYGKGPRADSYRPELPTFGFTDGELLRVSPDDRKRWAARPVVIIPPERARRLFPTKPDGSKWEEREAAA